MWRALPAFLVCLACAPSNGVVTAQDVVVPPPGVLRFVALGDTGHGNDTEYAIARTMESVCEAHGGCALALLLGDNIYPNGISSADDPQFESKLERPYLLDHFPFYGALGNHDYGGDANDFWRAEAEIKAAAKSQVLRMPARHYTFGAGPVEFFAVDTNPPFWGATSDEESALRAELATTHRPWRIAFGHHPYISNGPHGNAGHYDRMRFSWLPAAGNALRDFFEDDICGKVDAYICGHDHTMQDLGEICGTQFLIAGTGSEATRLPGHNPTLFQSLSPGFLYVEATDKKLSFAFYDKDGHVLHQREVTRP